ncbi:ECF transporter S component, partial [Enterococcus lactis]|uniref:ECF transporter S component n=2 Tax=Enterococcus TaxID=1350 RepID=UPI00293602C8|nr:ECF transporter S component [Enterococcus lactis]
LMINGYALATSWLYGVGAGIASLPGNIIQSLFGVIVALPLSQTLKRVLPKNGRLEERRMNK